MEEEVLLGGARSWGRVEGQVEWRCRSTEEDKGGSRHREDNIQRRTWKGR